LLVWSVAEQLAQEIVAGRYPPGMVLSSIVLADRFETSRSPIREAMLILEHHGLVEMPPRRQPRVAVIDRAEVREIYSVQTELLGMKFELCAQNASEEALLHLREAYEQMVAADKRDNADDYFWMNIAFHDVAADACGNATLKRILEPLRLRTVQLRRITLSQPSRRALSLVEHGHLLSACERRDAALAGAIIRALYRSALELLEARFDQEEAAARSARRDVRRSRREE